MGQIGLAILTIVVALALILIFTAITVKFFVNDEDKEE